ncbi:MAG: tetratricopeptide repeat protein [Armatimonadota bacterium]
MEWIPALKAGAESADALTRARSAFLLGQTAAPECRQTLRRLRRDADRDVRIHAGIGLGFLGEESAIGTCRAAVADGPNWRRVYAADALLRIGSSRARRAVEAALDIQSPHIRKLMSGLLTGEDPPRPIGRRAEDAKATRPLPPGSVTTLEQIFESAADILWMLTDPYWHGGDYESCIRLAYAATFLDPSHVDAWTSAAWLAWSNGRTREAEKLYQAAIEASPQDYQGYYEFGFHFFRLKQYGRAAVLLKRAAELPCPDYIPRMYAHALEKDGQLQASLAVWEELLKADPDNVIVKNNHDRVKRLVAEQE